MHILNQNCTIQVKRWIEPKLKKKHKSVNIIDGVGGTPTQNTKYATYNILYPIGLSLQLAADVNCTSHGAWIYTLWFLAHNLLGFNLTCINNRFLTITSFNWGSIYRPTCQRKGQHRRKKWVKPKVGWSELNVDESSNTSTNRAGAGGAVQYEQGHWLWVFASLI